MCGYIGPMRQVRKKKKERKNMASKILGFITYCSDILFVL